MDTEISDDIIRQNKVLWQEGDEGVFRSERGNLYKLLKVDEDGTEWRQYENGYIRNQRGSLLFKPADIMEHTITSGNHDKFVKARKDKYREAVEQGVAQALKAYDHFDAVSKIVGKRAEVAMSDDGRSGNDAAKIVLAALDALPDRKTQAEQVTRHEYVMDEQTIRLLEEMVKARRGDVIDIIPEEVED